MIKKINKKFLEEIPLDDYERELMEFINKGEFVSDPNFKKNKKIFEEAARKHLELEESKSITLRIKKKYLVKLKAKAEKKDIPYQTLIGLVLKDYAEGKTKLNL